MRNLLEHPITKEETREVFEHALKKVSYEETGLIGDLRPSIVSHLVENFNRIWYEVYDGRFPFETREKKGKEWKVHD